MLGKSNFLNGVSNFCDFDCLFRKPNSSPVIKILFNHCSALKNEYNRTVKVGPTNMTWWGHNLQLKALAEERINKEKKDVVSGFLPQSVREAIYNNFLAGLHFFLGFIAYGYLFLVAAVFFFQDKLVISPSTLRLVESLSEPYLGAIGIYLFVKEIRSRRGVKPRILNEAFVGIWLIFFFAASILTFVSKQYHIDPLYNLIMTNSLAAIIIRLGTVLHF